MSFANYSKYKTCCLLLAIARVKHIVCLVLLGHIPGHWAIAAYRKAVRAAASSIEDDQPSQHNFSDPSSLHKVCDFTLDLKAAAAANSSDPSGQLSEPSQDSELDSAGSRWLGRFWHQSSHEKLMQSQTLILNGSLSSRNCGIELQINATTTHIEVYEAKAVNYTFMVTALTFVQVRFTALKPTGSSTLWRAARWCVCP